MAERQITIPARCDAELLADLFDLSPHHRAALIAGTASAHITAKLDLIRKFRINAESCALLTNGRALELPYPAPRPVAATATLADALADQGRPE